MTWLFDNQMKFNSTFFLLISFNGKTQSHNLYYLIIKF